MNTMEKDTKKAQVGDVCCGGPAPQGTSACCVKDAEAKASGLDGCGCTVPVPEDGPAASCCGDTGKMAKETGKVLTNRIVPADESLHDTVRQAVREKYGRVAGGEAGCGCGQGCCDTPVNTDADIISQRLGYTAEDTSSVPAGSNMGLGCGNPQAIAALRPGETVLDLGSGGGFDCFLASKAVGETGHVIGVDMTPEMVSKARKNAEQGGYRNIEFRLGEIENLPVADDTVDVIISNCVINLSPDKPRVYAEAYRVLKPGGRLAVSDVVAFAELPEDIKRDLEMHTGCIAGASSVAEIENMLVEDGFERIRVIPRDESKSFMREWVPNTPITDYVISATIEAVKPAR
jgi:arsenite methyltransferase